MRPVDSKWVFKILRDKEGNAVRFKARLCVRGFRQVEGLDYQETFSPVVRYDSLRVFLALVTQLDHEMLQLDIKTAFLYGDLEEQIFMEVPEGLRDKITDKKMVYHLLKSWYGLKQAARCWNKRFTSELKKLGLKQCASDRCLFRGTIENKEVILALFVDDGLVAAKSQKGINIVKNALCESFEVKLGDSCRFVGVQIERDRKNKRMFIHQELYASKIVEKFGIMNVNPMCIPADPNQSLCRVADGGKK